jgi:putative selenium metabolism hydrolase
MDQLEDYLAIVEKNEPEIIAFLKQLVKTPSLSGEEGEIAGIISNKLNELGYIVDVDGMGNIIAQRGKGRGKTILFDGHLDHIQPGALEGWSHSPYEAEVVDGALFGRGTVDMKGALAAMIYGCAAPEVDGTVVMTLVVHEETKGLSIDACVLGEPTHLQLSVGQRGRCVFKITTKGATSHASMPELGVNALYLMTPIIDRIKGENENLPTHPFLGQGSMAVTTLRCLPGAGPIVPDHCEIEVDRRLVPQETLEGVIKEMQSLAPGAQVELLVDELECYTGYTTKADQYFPGWIIEEDHWAVKESLEALTGGMGKEPDIIGWRFSTDGIATAGQLGIPTVGFGPGDPSLAHQPDEHISLDDVMAAVKGYCALTYRLVC